MLEMRVVAGCLFNVMCLTRVLAQCAQARDEDNASKGVWSEELTKRLMKHQCKAGSTQKETTLLHGLKAGTFSELGHMKDLEACLLMCCESERCDLALLKNNFCYGITCYSPQHCKTAPAYGDDNSTAVALTRTVMANRTEQGAQLSQSGARNSNKKTAELVFYPVDSSSGSSDLAFSVNLRRIAKHYVHDERVRNALTAKADEHLTHRTTQAHDGHKGNGSTLDSFLSRGQATQSPRTERSGKRSHAIPKPTKHENTKQMEWGPKLTKVAISGSAVVVLVVLVVLLTMTRRQENK